MFRCFLHFVFNTFLVNLYHLAVHGLYMHKWLWFPPSRVKPHLKTKEEQIGDPMLIQQSPFQLLISGTMARWFTLKALISTII